jgi:hypothetical protein
MTYERLPYDDASTPTEMASDCAEVGRRLPAPGPRATALEGPSSPAGVVVPDELAELAAGLQLHID